MIKMNLHQICAIVGGRMAGKEARVSGVSTDSRQITPGQLFVALKGKNYNGEDFCAQAVSRGAVAVMVSQAVEVDVPQIICDNTLEALTAVAKAWLHLCQVKVIAVTGSNGKTTVKNMLHAVLSQSHRCFVTPGNLNNEIGVPLSLLEIDPKDEFAVIEMGAAKKGDIAYLTSIAEPDIALVNNVSNAHVGRFGSVENIAQGKGEIYQALSAQGIAIINQDDFFAPQWQEKLVSESLCFGITANVDVRLILSETSRLQCEFDGQRIDIGLSVLGRHNQYNACAVVTIAYALGISVADIEKGLRIFKPAPGRMEMVGQLKGVTVVNDSYNANLASSKAAIDVLHCMPKPTMLVMGDMAELGVFANQMHQDIGAYAEEKGIDQVIAVGRYASFICEKKVSGCQTYEEIAEVIDALKSEWPEKGTVLIKGSRGMGMERVVGALFNEEVTE